MSQMFLDRFVARESQQSVNALKHVIIWAARDRDVEILEAWLDATKHILSENDQGVFRRLISRIYRCLVKGIPVPDPLIISLKNHLDRDAEN